MQKRKKSKIPVRLLIMTPYLLVLYVLQAMVFPRFPVMGAKPLLLPIAVAGTALFGGHVAGGAMGLAAGMLCDLSFNQPTYQFTVVLTLAGLLVGVLSDTVLVQGFPSYLMCAVGMLVVCAVFQVFPMMFFHGAAFAPLLRVALAQTLYSLVFAIPLYYLARFVNRAV